MGTDITYSAEAESGHTPPTLQQAFNELAQARRFGQGLIDFCFATSYPVVADESLRATQRHGICTYQQISLLPGSNYQALAHEIRHGFQMRQLDVFWQALDNPFARHVLKRMIEADAFAHEDLITLDRWVRLGYTTRDDLPVDESANAEAFLILERYSAAYDSPLEVAQTMRHLFDAHYKNLGNNPLYTSYEVESINDAIAQYKSLHDRLIDPCKYSAPEELTKTLAMIDAFYKGEEEIRTHAKNLGFVAGLPLNYLTDIEGTRDLGTYAGPFSERILQEHVNWESRIEAAIEKNFTLSFAPK